MKKKCQKYTEIQRSGEGKYKDSRKEAVEKEDDKLSMTTAMTIQTKTHLAKRGMALVRLSDTSLSFVMSMTTGCPCDLRGGLAIGNLS
mgnify:CR=1 FL=1